MIFSCLPSKFVSEQQRCTLSYLLKSRTSVLASGVQSVVNSYSSFLSCILVNHIGCYILSISLSIYLRIYDTAKRVCPETNGKSALWFYTISNFKYHFLLIKKCISFACAHHSHYCQWVFFIEIGETIYLLPPCFFCPVLMYFMWSVMEADALGKDFDISIVIQGMRLLCLVTLKNRA